MIHFRFAAPRTRREKALARDIGAANGEALRSRLPELVAQLEARLEERTADRGPELAAPRPNGPLSTLRPLTIVD
jgi:hypothetical protein